MRPRPRGEPAFCSHAGDAGAQLLALRREDSDGTAHAPTELMFAPKSRFAARLALLSCVAALSACGPSRRPPEPTMGEYAMPKRAVATGAESAASQRRAEPAAPSPPSPSSTPSARGPAAGVRPAGHDARPPRARPLLVAELQALERLAASTPASAKEHPQLLRRIADDYVELSLRARMEDATPLAATARSKAKAAYERLEAEHPGFAPNDELLFFLASRYAATGDPTSARATFQSLIARHPSSRYARHAHLAIAELYFDEASTDPARWALAEAAYREALRSAPEDGVFGYARYKLAWVLANEGDPKAAALAFKEVLDLASNHPELPGSAMLGEAARADLDALEASPSNPRTR